MLKRNIDFIAVLAVLLGLSAVSGVRHFERELLARPIALENIVQKAGRAPCVAERLLTQLELALTN